MPSAEDREKETEIRQEVFRNREITLADLIAQEGRGFLTGETPAFTSTLMAVKSLVSQNLADTSGVLQAVLQTWIAEDQVSISKHLEEPRAALEEILDNILSHLPLLYELVEQVDRRYGQMFGERPYFQKPGETPHPEDEYTHESVTEQLQELLAVIRRLQAGED